MAKPFAWSHSALSSFETCPRRHYLTKVLKTVKEQEGPELIWGKEVHTALEHRLQGRPLGDRFAAYETVAAKVVAAAHGGKLEAEQKMCLNKSFRPTTYFANDAWVRAMADFIILKGDRALLGDWKTGKPKVDNDQLRLTAAMTFASRPHVNRIINTFVWLKDGSQTTEVFKRGEEHAIWQDFMPRVQRFEHALATNTFPPRPSGLCKRHCPVGRQNCEHCGS